MVGTTQRNPDVHPCLKRNSNSWSPVFGQCLLQTEHWCKFLCGRALGFVFSSNVGRIIGYSDLGLCVLSQFLQANDRVVPWNRPRPSPSICTLMNYPLNYKYDWGIADKLTAVCLVPSTTQTLLYWQTPLHDKATKFRTRASGLFNEFNELNCTAYWTLHTQFGNVG
jgi:hypothetical protein